MHIYASTLLQRCNFDSPILALCRTTDTVSDMRVLGRVRLSRATEESTSAERQREIVERWALDNDHEVVGWAEDLDVSGSVDPFDTPALGPWLAVERLHEWDILCTWKLDRLARRAVPLHRLFGLCQDEDKTLVCVSDSIDLSTWVGRLVASVIAGVAEGELEAIRERTRASQQKLRELGRWGGGKLFYGYRPQERLDAAGWELVPDEHASRVVLQVVDKVLDGRSTQSIARELNESGELAPSDYQRQLTGLDVRGRKWSSAHIRQQLRSRMLLGHMTHNGQTVRDGAGLPVRKGPALVSQDVFDRVQVALEARSYKKTNRSTGASPLLGVAICGLCSRLMYLRTYTKQTGTYRYYSCNGGHPGSGVRDHAPNTIKAGDLEDLVSEGFLDAHGAENVREKVFIPAVGHQAELDEAVLAVDEIAPLLGTVTSTTMRSRLLEQLSALDSRISALESLPTSDARWEWKKTTETYSEAWGLADTEGKRQLLLKREVTVRVTVRGKALEFSIDTPDTPGTQKSPPPDPKV